MSSEKNMKAWIYVDNNQMQTRRSHCDVTDVEDGCARMVPDTHAIFTAVTLG